MVLMTRLLILTSATFCYRVNAWSALRRSSLFIPSNFKYPTTTSSNSLHSVCRTKTDACALSLCQDDVTLKLSVPWAFQRGTLFLGRTRFLHSLKGDDASSTRLRRLLLASGSEEQPTERLEMENLYMEWTLEDDEFLYQHMNRGEGIPKLASKLGRGLRGVESRIAKLKDVNSMAYRRLFVRDSSVSSSKEEEEEEGGGGGGGKSKKLTPANEVMRRIKWDHLLNPDDFSVEYFDRVQETVVSVSFRTQNESVKGKEELFVFAIPEHRIMAIKYKDWVVWDKVCTLNM